MENGMGLEGIKVESGQNKEISKSFEDGLLTLMVKSKEITAYC